MNYHLFSTFLPIIKQNNSYFKEIHSRRLTFLLNKFLLAMSRILIITFLLLTSAATCFAQTGNKDALQKEREKLKNDIAETERILNETKKTTRVNVGQLSLINKKLDLQGNVMSNINGEIRSLTDEIYLSQLEINKMKRVLDTLKLEYSNSMVYAYKNRSNYDFLNFIFSADNFNDAIKRITYLKSYRNYREMQADNILKTQDILENKVKALSNNKIRKNDVLEEKSKELAVLEKQKDEKAKIVNKLKGKQKELTSQVNAKRKQDNQLKNTIAAMIKREIEIARAEAARIEKARLAEVARLAEIKRKKDAADAAARAKATPAERNAVAKAETPAAPAPKPSAPEPIAAITPEKSTGSVLVSSNADIALNASFEKNKGALPWPVSGYVIYNFGNNPLPGGKVVYHNPGVTIGAQVGATVKAVFDGEVTLVSYIEDKQAVFIKHGKYFTVYSNLVSVNVQKGSKVSTGQAIGKAGVDEEGDGGGRVDFILMQENDYVNPQAWLRK